MLMFGFSVCAYSQLILLEEDESEAVQQTVEQVIQPQQAAPTVQTTPAQTNTSTLTEESEEQLFQPAKSSSQSKKEAARLEAERKKAEEAAKKEAERVEAERKAAEEAAKAKAEAERQAAEEAAKAEAARVEAERKAAEEAAKAEAARVEAERKAAEEAAKAEAARVEAERKAAEEAAKAKAEAERQAAEEAAKAEAARVEAERQAAEEAAAAAVATEAARIAAAEEAARTAQAKADSIMRVQQEQEQQLRMLQEQQTVQQTEREREDAALMERARAEAEARAKAKAEAERRAQLEEERRYNAAQEDVYGNKEKEKKETIFTRYYKRNGQNMLSIISFGYSTYFVLDGNIANNSADFFFKRHTLNFQAFEWRAKCFGMQLFNFEMGLNSQEYFNGTLERGADINIQTQSIVNDIQPADAKTMWFAYKPAIKFYIPCTNWLALELYGGIEVDLCGVWSKINQSYYPVNSLIPLQNFFFAGYGGLGFMFTPTAYLPMELKAEYRHPSSKGNMAIVPQGVYLSLQIHIATPTKKR